jgi:hypothetical protein
MNHLVKCIISGGQTGADTAGLKAGRELGLKTGGWVPNGCWTDNGPNQNLVNLYGCKEHLAATYPPRTFANVQDSEATLRFAYNFNSRGEMCTLKAIKKFGKPYLDFDLTQPLPSVVGVRKWLKAHKVQTLNITGNSSKTNPAIEGVVFKFLLKLLH